MEKKVFVTYIRGDHELSENAYVAGRISGIMWAICDGENYEKGYARRKTDNGGQVLTAYCTETQYETFRTHIERLYPELCYFNI